MLRDVILEEARKILRFVKPSGNNNIGGPCPFHKGGMEKTASFYVSLDNGLFFCHACGEKGTFVQLLRRTGTDARKIDHVLEMAKAEGQEKPKKVSNPRAAVTISETILGALDFCPQTLLDAGFDKELLHRLDVGFDVGNKRITFPIRDLYGSLVAISGRTVVDDYPRYLVYRAQDLNRFAPADDPNKYDNYSVKNHEYLWNMHNVYPSLFHADLDTVIVVEGYKACIWMIQQGFENTVAIMGSKMTTAQESLLSKFTGSVFLFLDNNAAGKRGMLDAGHRLIQKGQQVWVFNYPQYVEEGAQPDSLDQDELKTGLDTSTPFTIWRRQHGVHSSKS